MKPISVFLLLFACVIAGLSGTILYNYVTLNAAKKQLLLLEADLERHNNLINKPYLEERAEVERRQVNPSQMISSDSPFLSEKQRYMAKIIAKVQQNWFVGDAMRGKECRVNMTLAPNGAVTSVTVLGGHRPLCISAVDAINKGSPYLVPSDQDVYDALKDLTMILQPELR